VVESACAVGDKVGVFLVANVANCVDVNGSSVGGSHVSID